MPETRTVGIISYKDRWKLNSVQLESCDKQNELRNQVNFLLSNTFSNEKRTLNIDTIKRDKIHLASQIYNSSPLRNQPLVNSETPVEHTLTQPQNSDKLEGRPTSEQLFRVYNVLEKSVSFLCYIKYSNFKLYCIILIKHLSLLYFMNFFSITFFFNYKLNIKLFFIPFIILKSQIYFSRVFNLL